MATGVTYVGNKVLQLQHRDVIDVAISISKKKKPGELEIDRFTARQKSLLTTGKQVSDEGN